MVLLATPQPMDTQLSKPLHELPDPLPLTPLAPRRPGSSPPEFTLRTPGSKSLTNRAMLLAALARGRSTLRAPLLDADDAARMLTALSRLGATLDREPGGDLTVEGVGGRWRSSVSGVDLDLGNAGTATRFLAASALLAPGPVSIDGNARMRQRPIGELTDALQQLGMDTRHSGAAGCPPVTLSPPQRLPVAPTIDIGRTQSSQFVSALLMLGPFLSGGITLRRSAPLTSPSYVRMTLGLLTRLGATVMTSEDLRVMRVGPPGSPDDSAPTPGLDGFDYAVEPDASGATYFWAAGALVPGLTCTLLDLGEDSLQGDTSFVDLLARMGARVSQRGGDEDGGRSSLSVTGPAGLRAILADMTDMPDAAMTLGAVACFAQGTSILRGLRTLRVKESDRIDAMRTELSKLGVTIAASVSGDDDAITITPPPGGIDCSPGAPKVEFDTYDDHRMAMSLALVGLRRPNVFIRDPRCVAKTYPTFWRDLGALAARSHRDAGGAMMLGMLTELDIRGMHCAGCVDRLTGALRNVPGVTSVHVTLDPPRARLESGGALSREALDSAVRRAGDYSIVGPPGTDESLPRASGASSPDAASTEATSLYPLVLIVAYIAGAAALATFVRGDGSWRSFMLDFMAGFFLVFSLFKLLDLRGFADAYQTYDIVARRSRAYALAYPFLELALGVAYLVRWQPTITNGATLVLMIVSSVGVLRAVLSKRRIRCACLGTSLNLPMTTITLVEDLGMALMAGAALVWGH